MTGYGRGSVEDGRHRVQVEVRTVNGKFLDLNIRLPKNYMEFEETVRTLVRKRLHRGRADIFIQVEPRAPELIAPQLNLPLARHYWNALQELHRNLPGSEPPQLEALLRFPDLFRPPEDSSDPESLRRLIAQATDEALEQVLEMRKREGNALARDVVERLGTLENGVARIADRQEEVAAALQERLRERVQNLLQEMNGALDEHRLLQEVAYMLDRMDINEELVRLRSHLKQMKDIVASSETAVGRRLDFLTQELHREVNTIGSKTGDLEISQTVVQMKNEIGKLKEQVQNIE